ncbi:MAG: ribonuclease Z [Bacteroidetes bacterium]|nr:ribonuclease Z [Bacteroidota bacterium]
MSFWLKILGSNAAAPAHSRNQTSQLLRVNSQIFLIDCGEGTQHQLKKYGVKLGKIDHIFISHLHGDHFYGLIGLISTLHLYGRKKSLFIYGPPGLGEIITIQLKHSNTSLTYDIVLKEWKPETSELIFESKTIEVSTFPMDHRISCSGFLFKEKPLPRRINKKLLPRDILPSQIGILKSGRNVENEEGDIIFNHQALTIDPRPPVSYAYCSDTRFTDEILPFINGVNIIYHEATFMEDMADRAVLTFHSTARQAATIAKMAGVDKLIIGHFSTRYKNLKPLLVEAKEVFENSYLGIEGCDFVLVD